jgi:ribonuclease D
MSFIDNMPKHIDLHKVFSKLHPQSKSTGLATCCETILEKKLCKKEQMSNWEQRPLRFSQEHYAAMDAWILGQLVEKLFEKSKKQKVDTN